jgi:hypothetical protein
VIALLSGIASKEEYTENERFTDELSQYYERNKRYLSNIWVDILEHLDEHITLKDCGISSLCQEIG